MSRFLPLLVALFLLALAPLVAGCDNANPLDPSDIVETDPDDSDPDSTDPDDDSDPDDDDSDPDDDDSDPDDPDGDPPSDTVDAEVLAALFGCEVAVVEFDTAVEGALDAEGDCTFDDGRMVDYFAFVLSDDTPLAVEALSDAFDTVLYLYDEDGALLDENDDLSDDNTDSLIERDVPAGVYVVGLSAYGEDQSGAYLFLTK